MREKRPPAPQPSFPCFLRCIPAKAAVQLKQKPLPVPSPVADGRRWRRSRRLRAIKKRQKTLFGFCFALALLCRLCPLSPLWGEGWGNGRGMVFWECGSILMLPGAPSGTIVPGFIQRQKNHCFLIFCLCFAPHPAFGHPLPIKGRENDGPFPGSQQGESRFLLSAACSPLPPLPFMGRGLG